MSKDMKNGCRRIMMTQGCEQVVMPDVRNERSADAVGYGRVTFIGSDAMQQPVDGVVAHPV